MEGSYRFAPVNSTFMRKPAFWHLLSEQGRRVAIVNVPMAYPPQPVNGVLVGGFTTPPNATDNVIPGEFADELRREVPAYNTWLPELQLGHGNEATYLRKASELIDAQFDAMALAMRWVDDWELFFGVVQFPDQVFHWFWKFDDPRHPRYDPASPFNGSVRKIHQQLDRRLGDLRALAGEDSLVMVMSDHGNGPLHRDLYIDTLLAERGWTKFRRNPLTRLKLLLRRLGFTPARSFQLGHRAGLGTIVRNAMRFRRGLLDRLINTVYISRDDIDWSRTSAYAYGTWASIHMNVEGREPSGSISRADYERVRSEIIADLKGVIDPETDAPVFKEVLSSDEVYSGEYARSGPDIHVLPADEKVHPVALVPFASDRWIEPPYSSESGWHRMQGMLLLDGPGVARGSIEGARIEDAGATLLSYMGLGTTPEMDGRPLTEAFAEEVLSTATLQPTSMGVSASVQPYSKEEQELISKRLQDLGY
jgi:predicted AlkP superfamily phosphohydrolase/phosphomutase